MSVDLLEAEVKASEGVASARRARAEATTTAVTPATGGATPLEEMTEIILVIAHISPDIVLPSLAGVAQAFIRLQILSVTTGSLPPQWRPVRDTHLVDFFEFLFRGLFLFLRNLVRVTLQGCLFEGL